MLYRLYHRDKQHTIVVFIELKLKKTTIVCENLKIENYLPLLTYISYNRKLLVIYSF